MLVADMIFEKRPTDAFNLVAVAAAVAAAVTVAVAVAVTVYNL